MELLSHPKTEYLLDATLESLHRESVAWLEVIKFFRDEISLFHKLLHNQKLSNGFPSEEIAEVDKALVRFNGESLDKVRNDLSKQEKQLAAMLKSSSLSDEQSYRESHRKLLVDMQDLLANIKMFKQKVSSFAEVKC